MENPWLDLPTSRPFLLKCDDGSVANFNRNIPIEQMLRTEVIPEPYHGNITAKIILLSLNPGFDETDYAFHHHNRAFIKASFGNLAHTASEFPFYLLNPEFSCAPGHGYWMKRLKELVFRYGAKRIAQEIGVIQWLGYHSRKSDEILKRDSICPSQDYGFNLVKQAMKRDALIVIIRSAKKWHNSVPGLADYEYLSLSSTRNQAVSENNVTDKHGKKIGLGRIHDALN
jgi:hypothetical protein